MTDSILAPSLRSMLDILKLFVIPVGGIPAGVLLAQANGVPWPVTAILYLVSDILLAIAFEPMLRLMARFCSRIPRLSRFGALMRAATARSVAHYGGAGASPLTLVMIAFGVDPMTGRASALAAGYGFVSGWAFAIAGDMLYFAVIAVTAMGLNSYIRNPEMTMLIVLGAMLVIPMVIRRLRVCRQGASELECRDGASF